MAGMNGAIGSMDIYHVLKQNHLGGKSKQTCRSFNLTSNHCRQILHTKSGHPARWNDKTIVLMDELATQWRKGKIMLDNIFELFEYDGTGVICSVKYRGVWLLIDNGYFNWSTTIPPLKHTMMYKEIRWYEWLKSMRKDVECTFGILKGRWRLLKSGIRLHGVDACDNIWKTCCALHNMILFIDGLIEEWDGELGLFDIEDAVNIQFALRRLSDPSEIRNYELSGMGCGSSSSDSGEGSEQEIISLPTYTHQAIDQDSINDVHRFPIDLNQNKLIEHVDELFKQNKIWWPRTSVK